MYHRRQELSMSNKPKMAYSRDLAYMDYHRLSWTGFRHIVYRQMTDIGTF